MIVGEEITSRDLVPVFDGFLNDLDEVRIGVLKHLADFLKVRSSCLTIQENCYKSNLMTSSLQYSYCKAIIMHKALIIACFK